MTNHNLYLRLVGDRFEKTASQPFLITPGRRPLLFSELDRMTGCVAARLLELNVEPGDRVMVQVSKSPESVLVYLACLRIGAIYTPLNPAYTTAEVSYFMTDSKPQLLICQPIERESLFDLSLACKVPHIRTLGSDGDGDLMHGLESLTPEMTVVEREADDLAAILYTSGTTGRSKGAMLTHHNLASNAEVLHSYWHWQDQHDVLLHALPVFHVHGLFVALHCALLGCSTVYFLSRFDTGQVIDRLPDCTVMMGVPTFYTRLLSDARLTPELCSKMRLFISGSAPLLAETHREFEQRSGFQILERYGMTEAGMITSNPYHGDRLAGTVGYALPGVSVRIADNNGNELPRGEIGVLELKGPNVFKGYWQMPEKSAAEFRQGGWFISGDNAIMDQTGRISIVGRAKDLIISGGYNIYPKEIEAVIDTIPGVAESAVVGVPHADFGEAVAAIVVKDGSRQLGEQEIIEPLQGRLARFKQPKRVFFVDELPRNSMGKVQKAELRDTYKESFGSK
ncbi:malonyl-CoA synthase [Candidatus Thiodiazotropha endoloripes]|uniref:malonate--CoA ligase n=1 Tax=Candidatus Thiodiazotropha endoloripes TaxID=1818881 RepID=UPI00083E4825|nr:malonyl-CoA synthase [Candidatus Thiodiazotropha endoloripes]MCG7901839.1 malonyl-CoA synthase [Candidatus Thiodiazotropha weberae]ODB83060.1 malonyl-CoA synthase [Candidatus Thiodiazotropha endoloripes]ODB90995.1 malonyl-CoA synthase [Candidatus Thiodiazotropha endoloripes]